MVVLALGYMVRLVPDRLVGLESQGRGSATHPVAGCAIRPSCYAGFGRCSAVLVVTV